MILRGYNVLSVYYMGKFMLPQSFIDGFWEKVKITPGCWEWTASKNQAGRGIYNPRRAKKLGISPLAYRVSWRIHYGELPEGLWVLHTCDNPTCVNPQHLFLGTSKDNTLDMLKKDRSGKSKLTPVQVLSIRSDERPRRVIAKEYGITLNMVKKIKSQHSWSWLHDPVR